jgi:hypothetical protein
MQNYLPKAALLPIAWFCVFTSARSHAQNTHSFHGSEISLGPEFAAPTGGFRAGNGTFDAIGSRYSYGVGGSMKYVYHLNNRYGLSLQAGAVRYYARANLFFGEQDGL